MPIYFQIIIFENPHLLRVVGWATMPCMLNIENHFKHVHEMGGRNMRYTLDIIVVSIGIIGSFQLVSILTFFCILIYFFLYVCLLFQIVSISIGI